MSPWREAWRHCKRSHLEGKVKLGLETRLEVGLGKRRQKGGRGEMSSGVTLAELATSFVRGNRKR